jgi:hypothetical protein
VAVLYRYSEATAAAEDFMFVTVRTTYWILAVFVLAAGAASEQATTKKKKAVRVRVRAAAAAAAGINQPCCRSNGGTTGR